MSRALVVDDEERITELTAELLEEEGHEVRTAASAEEALREAASFEPEVVLLDLKLPGRDGLEVLAELKRLLPATEVIIVTAYGTIESAVEAMKRGAADYLTKPFNADDLLLKVERALERHRLRAENRRLRSELAALRGAEEMIGRSGGIRRALAEAMQVAPLEVPVLLRGESGTGKTLLARLIHRNSPRAGGPMVELNCAALSENLLENELFGHEREAFTGAASRRKGKIELAAGGTLLLDEIADMSLPLQAKLLKVIEDRSFFRLGGEKPVEVRCRFLFATNADLEARVEDGSFRRDLYYRINVYSIHLPPLRQRTEDIPLLAEHLLARHGVTAGISPEVMRLLSSYHWPGNIRELENVLVSASIRAAGALIRPEHLPPYAELAPRPAAGQASTLSEAEKRAVEEALRRSAGNKSEAARILGISRKRLYSLIRKYDIRLPGADRETRA